jgi:hypothetical protein
MCSSGFDARLTSTAIHGTRADARHVRRPRRALRTARRLDRALVLVHALPPLRPAYPVDKPTRSDDDFMFFGSRSLYERADFRVVVRRSPTWVVMRRRLRARSSG